jgi:hypothetical protein
MLPHALLLLSFGKYLALGLSLLKACPLLVLTVFNFGFSGVAQWSENGVKFQMGL